MRIGEIAVGEGAPLVLISGLNVIEEEIKTGIRHFSEILEGARDSREGMDKILRSTWNRRVQLKT